MLVIHFLLYYKSYLKHQLRFFALFQPVEENHLGLEMYCSEEKLVTKKEIVDEFSVEDISKDYHQVGETTTKPSESFEIKQNPFENKPTETDELDCYCRMCNRSFQNKVSYHRHMMVSIKLFYFIIFITHYYIVH